MIIGIDGSRGFMKKRTGIEEYSYQVIRSLRDKLSDARVVLYLRHGQEVDFDLPENWKIKKLWAPRYWTQIRLSLEMLFNPIDALFIPAHTVPFIHPARNALLFKLALTIQKIFKLLSANTYYNRYSDAGGPKKTAVTIHGLEYEVFPKAYSFWERIYMRWSIKNSCKWASRIICVSENTKKDLGRLYGVGENKIEVIYEGYSDRHPDGNTHLANEIKNPYLLFIGRIEARKNIPGIIEAFEKLKSRDKIPHKLVLAGKPGYGCCEIKNHILKSEFKEDIIETGYVSENRKWGLLKNADVFLFPTLYEGFGIPILEAQSVGTPVVAGNNSSIPEVTNCYLDYNSCHPERAGRVEGSRGCSALLVDVNDPQEIAEAAHKLISDENLKNDIIEKGNDNVKRFSWEKCAREIADILQ